MRPFGVSLLVAGYDALGPHLYQVDPSGSYWAWKASAIGKNSINAKTFLEKQFFSVRTHTPRSHSSGYRYHDDIELDDAVHTTLRTLKSGFDGQMDENNIEVAVISADKKFTVLSPSQIKDFLELE